MASALADAAVAQAIDTKVRIEKRSVQINQDYESFNEYNQPRIEPVSEVEYILINQPKTYFEARNYCEKNRMTLSRLTDDRILNKATGFTTEPLWLNLIKPEPICKNTKCYSWHSRLTVLPLTQC